MHIHSPPKKSRRLRMLSWISFGVIVGLWLVVQIHAPQIAHASHGAIAGRVIDSQGNPLLDVEVLLLSDNADDPLTQDTTHEDGTYILVVPDERDLTGLYIEYHRPHFSPQAWTPTSEDLDNILEHGGLVLGDRVLERRITVSFWIASIVFVGMLIFIAAERLHNTLAALLALAVLLAISFVGGAINPDLYIYNFDQALHHVDFEVIFLLLGMMIIIGIIEETGIFQWLAFRAYKLARGRAWLLSVILMVTTAITSALLDNVITMLLIAPITLQIALAMGIDPLSLLIPEILSSNIGGISTLVGTPTNMMIGSFAGFGFNDFLINLAPGALMAQVGLIIFVLLWYRKEYRKSKGSLSARLLQQLEANAKIKNPTKLRKSGIVFGILIVLFVVGESIHLTPAVSAIIGSVVMLIWVHPDIEGMMTVVDWTTLMFFIGLFMVVGAVQEVGLIALIAEQIGRLVGGSPIAALLVVIWVSALGSGMVENIPFAAAMLPVVRYLSQIVPNVNGVALYYGLAVGTGMGGNTSLIGSSPNLVTAGISERAGFPITFRKFLVVGLPATLITVGIACLWLLVHF